MPKKKNSKNLLTAGKQSQRIPTGASASTGSGSASNSNTNLSRDGNLTPWLESLEPSLEPLPFSGQSTPAQIQSQGQRNLESQRIERLKPQQTESSATVNTYITANTSASTTPKQSHRSLEHPDSSNPQSPKSPLSPGPRIISPDQSSPATSPQPISASISRSQPIATMSGAIRSGTHPHTERNGTGGRDSHSRDSREAAREPLIPRSNVNNEASVRKAESLRRKLRTYESILALSSGCMPDTQQLIGWGQYILNSGTLDSRNRRLSSQGREFIRDLRAWIEAMVDLIGEKNSDDKVQEFIWHTAHGGVEVEGMRSGQRDVGQRMSKDAGRLMKRLRGLAALLGSSGEFRGLVGEVATIGRDLFADAASSVASTAGHVAEKARESDPSSVAQGGMSSRAVKEKGVAVSESAKKGAYQFRDEMESYLREKFPKQRRDAVVNRLKKVITDIQENPEYQETVDFVVEIMKGYVKKIKEVAEEAVDKDDGVKLKTDEHWDIAVKDIQALLMAFADGKPLDPINDALRKVVDDVQSDKDLKEFYDQVAEEFNRLLTQKGYVTSDAADNRAHELYNRSQELLNEKQDRYRPDVENLFTELRSFIDAIRNDQASLRLVEASKKVYNDIVKTDKYGNFRGFRKRIIWDIIGVIFPKFIEEIKYIPIPRVEYQDRDYDLILENVVLESEHFLPTRTILEAFTRVEIRNAYTVTSSHTTTTHLHISNINLFVRDASFIVRKKTGVIPFNDRGYIDVFMTGRGASADVVLESVPSDDDDINENYFHVKSVDVEIHSLTYNYHAYHTWAASLLSPFIKPAIKKMVANILEGKIKAAVEMADREIHAAAERMRVASIATRGGGSVEAWIRAVLSRPPSARRSSLMRGEFRVNVDEPQLFPGEHAPGSVLAKMKRAEDRVEAGMEQEGWRNQVFSVGA